MSPRPAGWDRTLGALRRSTHVSVDRLFALLERVGWNARVALAALAFAEQVGARVEELPLKEGTGA